MALEPFRGEERFAAPPERVYAALTDLEGLVRRMPGFVSCEVAGAPAPVVRAVVRPGFSFLNANLKLTITLVSVSAPTDAALRIAGQSIGMSVRVGSEFRIEPRDGGAASTVRWEARVEEMKGLIAAVGDSLIRAAADKVIRDGWGAVRRGVEGSSGAR